MLYQLIKNLVLPPTGLVLLILLGALRWRTAWGRVLVVSSALTLLILSLPIVSQELIRDLEPYPALSAEELLSPRARAIVVLGAGRYTGAAEFGGDNIGPLTLQRVRYAAWLQRRTRLPLIISGGSSPDKRPTLAELMRHSLEQEFQVPVMAIEGRSRNTWENALFTSETLKTMGLEKIYLVTHAWHLPRAVRAFEQNGIQTIPAPTAFYYTRDPSKPLRFTDFLPNAAAMMKSYYATHEYLGHLWYRIRTFID